MSNRRDFLRQLAGASAWGWLRAGLPAASGLSVLQGAGATRTPPEGTPVRRQIPRTGERIPSIGMGTYITFNVGSDEAARERRTEVLRTFFRMGGGMIDSSPMYGTSEEVVGAGLRRLVEEDQDVGGLFSATKVWTRSTAEGPEQIERSLELWGIPRFDLMQIHNLVNWEAHLDTLRERREAGTIRYVGVTTSHGRRHDELARILRHEDGIDFVQLTYNILDREVEEELLPLAAERGIAVIANRPFRRGALFDRFANQPLPEWASAYDIANWAQFFLKFITSDERVTCAIPATSDPAHMRENMGALYGPLPDPDTREAMIDYVASR